MIPIVFCASFDPWLNEKAPDERSWSRRNQRSTRPGRRFRTVQRLASPSRFARTKPRRGEITMKASTGIQPSRRSALTPTFAIAAPA